MSPPTPEQEAALAAAAGSSATAIAAGAGAGKTTLMVEAIWRDVERDGVPLERIFVAAYNRAAAAHLSARLQARFSDPHDGRGADRVGLDLSGAWVGTFHSLAARIVRESPFVAGVDPDFGEVDAIEAAALMEQALDHALEEAMAIPGFVDLVTDAPTLTGVRDATRHVHERLRAAGHDSPRILVPPAPGPSADLLARMEGAMLAVAGHPRVRPDHHAVIEAAREMLLVGLAGAAPPKLALNCAQDIKPLCIECNGCAADVFQALLDQEAAAQLAGFAAHLDAFTARYAALKNERGVLDYEDLLLAARRVLRTDHGYRFARLYVDEFQDANALQAEIVDRLAAERAVVVGDGCQAIYGFRHADATHFVARTGSPPAVTLRDNHRSQAPLLQALNGLLGEALADEPTFAPLTPMARSDRPGPPLDDAPLRIVDVIGEGAPTTREQEAEVVADLVETLLADGYRRRDIAVLFRALTAVEPYRAAIVARGIPVHLVSGRGFFTHEQVADTLALLALVENPLDEEALVRVLGSPYVAASDDDLVALRRRAGPPSDRWPDEGALWPAMAAVPALAPSVAMVEALRPLRRERGLAGTVEAAVEAADYDLAALGLPDGARRYANLRRLVRMAGAYAAVRGSDLRGFLGLMRMMAEAGNQDPGEATLVDPDLDAVRLATVHGVKGQEFPAVIIADASHGMPTTSPMVLVDADGVAGIRISRVGGGPVPALGFADHQSTARIADAAEELRITYVAATRAERHLSVVGRSSARGATSTGTFDVLTRALGLDAPGVREYPGGGRVARADVHGPAQAGGGVRPRVEPNPVHPALAPVRIASPVPDRMAGRRLSFTALSTLGTCALRFHLEYERGLRGSRETWAPEGSASGGASLWGGAALGDTVHAELADHAWDDRAPEPGWASTRASAVGLPASAADASRAERLVAGLLASPLADRVRAGARREAERPFALELDGVLVSGAIDLLVEEPADRALVLDWKSHRLGTGRSSAQILAGYALQRALYGLAALRGGYREVALQWVLLEDIAASPVSVVTQRDVAALEGEIRAALEPLRSAARPPAALTPQPFCAGCPGLQSMCPVALTLTG